jgi:hypothetical protein
MATGSVPYKVGPCPHCRREEVWQRFSLTLLRSDDIRLEFYCSGCDHVWRPTTEQRVALLDHLEREARGDLP